ncbi:MAG: hypothetical protein GX829_08440 [Clostridium sp.]|jgi:hypothetical protein|nr:hypothetical protein [Clostridium sp.]
MKVIKRIGYSFFFLCLILSNKVLANEEIKKASVIRESDVYLKAFYAAFATLLVILIVWLIIFRPKFNGSDHKV